MSPVKRPEGDLPYAEGERTPTRERARPRAWPTSHDNIDWVAAERSPEFKELIAKRRRFVLPATIFFLTWYFGFVILAGYAPDFMGESIYEGLTVGYAARAEPVRDGLGARLHVPASAPTATSTRWPSARPRCAEEQRARRPCALDRG